MYTFKYSALTILLTCFDLLQIILSESYMKQVCTKHRWIIKCIKMLALKLVDMIKFAVSVQNSSRLLRVDHKHQWVNVV